MLMLRLNLMGQDFYRILGLEVGGAKNERTALAVLNYYPKHKRLLVVDIDQQLSGQDDLSTDEVLIDRLSELSIPKKNPEKSFQEFWGLGVHGPLSLPPSFSIEPTKSAGKAAISMTSRDPQIKWMNEVWQGLKPRPRPFCPYLQRPAEVWLRYVCGDKFMINEALGSNMAPIAVRLNFLKSFFPQPLVEVYPRATLLRIISSLGLPKRFAAKVSDLDEGLSMREEFFEHLLDRLPQLFVYERDLEKMIVSPPAMNAFLCALNMFLVKQKQTEVAPGTFPKEASWIPLPKRSIDWEEIL